MAGRRLVDGASAARGVGSNEIIDAYLADLGARLHGPAHARRAVLEEIRTDLVDSVEQFTRQGMPEADAARVAVSDLGSAAVVADAFAGELAIVHARRMLRILLITGPVVGVWWFILLAPDQWASYPGMLIAAIPALPIVAAAVATAIVVFATTGSLIRWVPEATPFRTVILAALVGLACIVGDLTVLSALLIRAVTGSAATLPLGIAVVAVLASAIRLPLAAWATVSTVRIAGRLRRARPAGGRIGDRISDRPGRG
ncbi:permease prefix domain 1-containing protein [Agromyces sp. Soil535]|uniref:permease prefix domain 1-containing protein n=1 Tax=Agromyces sp. Soil535 TaxID=1736390 RepID=UPI000701F42A|nr:permease prefix domain 1-containing protein [Agromyces sp. Soil535]KRE21737.1 hypothetical protein ASG80_11585 [Agromyces sp. Soil535]